MTTTIAQASAIAVSRNAPYWLHQVNRDLPYDDIDAMEKAAISEGLIVTQKSAKMFLVNYKAWVHSCGCVSPV